MSLPCQITGPKAAPALLFLHGGGVSGWMWEPVVELLSERFRCIVPDLPGHGRAQQQRFSFEGTTRALVELIDSEANGQMVNVVGLSLGAQTALHLLAAAPDRIAHAVMSGTLTRSMGGFSAYRILLRLMFPLSRQDWMIRANAKQLDIPPAFLDQFRADTLAATAEGLEAVVGENMAFRLPEGLSQASIPTLALVGEHDIKTLHRCAIDLAQTFPWVSAYMVPKAGHTWCLHQPQLFADVVEAFVTGQPLPETLVRLS